MQEIIVNKCDCPFEVSAIVDLQDLVPGTRYSYTLKLINAGIAKFHPENGEFTANRDTDTLNLTMYLKDNPNHHYLISFELFDPYYDSITRQIICVKNIGCQTIQCTPTITPSSTNQPYKLNKYLDISNYQINSNKNYGTFKQYITVGDWVEFLNSVATYDDLNQLWKPEMELDIRCGIKRQYDGFFYVYSVNGCILDEFGCYDNDAEQLNRSISYVGWSDLARYINWIHNGKPKGAQGPETTEDGSYPLYGNRYLSPGIPHHPGCRFWLDTTTVIQQCPVTATPTTTPTPSVTIGLTPTATPTTTATRTPTPTCTPPLPSASPTTTLTATPTTTTTLTATPTTTTTLTATPTNTPSKLPVGITISSQPTTDIFTVIGINKTISVTAVASPNTITLLYQWQKSTDGGSSWSNISGATSSTYIITNPQLVDNGNFYRVIVSGSAPVGMNNPSPITSNTSILSVTSSQVYITQHPVNITVANTTASFSVVASIDPTYASLSYQWQVSTDSGLSFDNVSGATSSTINLTNLNNTNSGNVYRVVVSGNGGATPVTSSNAVLVVLAPQITITTQPSNATAINASASFTVAATIQNATGYTLSYQWERSSDGGSNFSTIAGATSSTYTLNNITRSLNNYVYRVIVSSNVGSTPVASDMATLSVTNPYGGLLVWGSNSNNQLNFTGTPYTPSFTNNNTAIYRSASLGQNHSLFVNASGILETYGSNTLGQSAGNLQPSIVKIATKYNHNLVIIATTVNNTTVNKLYACGFNTFGQCGQGNTSAPITSLNGIPSDTNSYIDIATGENHSLAVRSNGVMVSCGRNDAGQLGIGNNQDQYSFVTVSTNIAKVACGQSHSAAIGTNGVLYTWGSNSNGQLGLADTSPRTSPVALNGSSWIKVVCGQNFTAALNSSNELYTWGANNLGQLGTSNNNQSTTPVLLDGSWSDISAGNLHMLGIKTDGTLWAWGNGVQGQIGNGGTISSSTPVMISDISDNKWENVYAGGNSSCATRKGSIITISNQPVGVESNEAAAQFSVSATITAGASLSYQWQKLPSRSSYPVPLLIRAENDTIQDISYYTKYSTLVGNTSLSTTQAKFGTQSIYFDGNNDYITIPTLDDSFSFGADDFTIECWLYRVNSNPLSFLTTAGGTNANFACNILLDGRMTFYDGSSTYTFGNSTPITNGAWHHVAFCRTNGVLRAYCDGAKVGTDQAMSTTIITNATLCVVASPSGTTSAACYIEELRVTKASLYSGSTYTVPTAPFDTPASWTDISNKTSSILNLTSLNNRDDSSGYRCRISGTDGAYTVYSQSPSLIEASSTVWYRGTQGTYDIIIPDSPGINWTQWHGNGDSWNYGSSRVLRGKYPLYSFNKNANTNVVQFVRTGTYGVAFLMSNGIVNIISTGNSMDLGSVTGTRSISNPSNDNIVKIIGNYGIGNSQYNIIYGIGASGKLYAYVDNGAAYGGNANVWNRIGSNLLVSDVAAIPTQAAYYSTVFAISAADGTLWAWGDERLYANSTSAGSQTFTKNPIMIGNDTWTSIAGNGSGFYAIKSDGAVYRLVGSWGGGSVYGANGTSGAGFSSGTLGLTNNTITPVLVDNSTAYTKLAANNNIIIGYDISNKLHINPNFNLARDLPAGWSNISNILLGNNSAALGAVILSDNYTSNTNIAMMVATGGPTVSYNQYGSTTVSGWSSTSTYWGNGTNFVTGGSVRPEFKCVIPDLPGYYLALKDD